ncbi:P-type DNA transfer ATPase VirB11 [Novosphingopyxis sp.]|uniref:P-type DNA transfer ATPase VirB11 n=1 Tax=Novosphingopyxis sp. TaxID=2709690 RepID=UPI003B59EDDF
MTALAVDTADAPVYLHSYLAPLANILARPDVTDIYINAPGEYWIETLGGTVERRDDARLTEVALERLSRQIAAIAHQGISRAHPMLSASLPDGSRVQIVFPPATRGPVAIAIRKHLARGMTLDDYESQGAFDTVRQDAEDTGSVTRSLRQLHADGEYAALLGQAVRARKNILISGGTSSGKTTFLNALLKEIPPAERLITIEDAPELIQSHANMIGLIAARSRLSEADVSAEALLGAALRMRPDRILLGEIRGPEAFTFLRAINSGHPGSMTTIHADSPRLAVEQMALLVMQSGARLSRQDVAHYIRSTIDIFVQLGRRSGKRFVEAVTLGGQLAARSAD